MAEKISSYDYVQFLVTNHLNGIKYLYGTQMIALYEILHRAYRFDVKERKDCECALASVKEAVQIYFGYHQGVDLGEPFPSKLDEFNSITVDSIKVTEWNGKISFSKAEDTSVSSTRLDAFPMFHYAYKLEDDEQQYEGE